MDTAAVSQIHQIMMLPSRLGMVLMLVVGVAGVVGAVMAATTRADAFEAANRQSKGAWVGILALAALACLLRFPFIAWFGAVAIGIYFFDVRPHIQRIVNGDYGW